MSTTTLRRGGRIGLSVWCVLGILLGAVPALAQTATISGTVIDTSNNGIAGVQVELIDTVGNFVKTSPLTTNSGTYSITGITPGTYFLKTFNSGPFVNQNFPGVDCNGFCSQTGGVSFQLAAGETKTANFTLKSGGLISGKITPSSGSFPAFSTYVLVYNASGLFMSTSDWADASGNYAVPALLPGTYYVRTNNFAGYINKLFDNLVCGSSCNVTSGTGLTLTAGGTATANFTLDLGAKISGKIVNEAGTALSGVTVQAYANGSFMGSGSTDASGDYTVAGLAPGTYNLRTFNFFAEGYIDQLYATPSVQCLNCDTRSGGLVTVSGTATTTGIDFTLKRGGVISGTVRDTANAVVPFVSIQLYDAPTSRSVVFTSTNSSGGYTSPGLPDGTYFVRTTFNSAGLINQLFDNINCLGCSVASGTPVTVTAPSSPSAAASVSTANFNLAPGGKITGTVTRASDSSALSGVVVVIHNTAGSSFTSTSTDSLGSYTLSGLQSGSYYVRTSGGGTFGVIDQVHATPTNQDCVGCSVLTLGSLVSVTAPNTTASIDFALAAGGSITGTITNAADNQPILNQVVFLNAPSGAFITSRSTNSSGGYTFGGLPTGDYYLRTSNNLGFTPVIYDGSNTGAACLNCPLSTGTAIGVIAGQVTSGKDLKLTSGKTISGKVSSSAAGSPGIVASVEVYSPSGSFVAGVTTNSSGTYSIGGLPAGIYYARTFNSLGFINQLYDALVCPTCSNTSGTAIDLTSASSASVNFTLSPGARISGTVKTATGALPITGAGVSLYAANGSFVTSGGTNDLGRFVIGAGLAPGVYYARATSTGFVNQLYNKISCNTSNCSVTSGTAINVSAGATLTNIDFEMVAGGTVTGRVTDDPAGSTAPVGIESVIVAIYDAVSGLFINSTSSSASGAYSVRGLPAGTYVARTSNGLGYIDEVYDNYKCIGCSVTSGKSFTVTAGQTTPAIDFKLERGGRISGTVTAASGGAPISGVNVSVYNSQNQFVTSTSTNQNGVYSTSGMAAGTYYVRTTFNSGGFINQLFSSLVCVSCNASTGTPVTVTGTSTTSGINFALVAGGRVTGRVTDASNANAATNGVPSVTVVLYDGTNASVVGTSTNSSGGYTISGVPAGTYYARTTFNSLGYINQLYSGITCTNCSVTGGTSFTVAAGTTTDNINFALSQGGAITGTVTDSSNAPIGGVTVQVFAANGQFIQSRNTAANGTYQTSDGLPGGTYFVRTSNSLGYVDELFNDTTCLGCSVLSGSPVSVTVGQTTSGINFSLATGGVIAGAITSQATGQPLESISVSVYTAAGQFVTSGFTNALGTYKTGSMPSGSYYVRSSNSRGFIDQVYNNKECTQCNPTTGTPVIVGTGTTNDINFALRVGGRIKGTVLTDTTPSAPLPGVSVRFYNAAGVQVANGFTDSQGSYVTYGGLPAGTYYSRTSNSSGFIDEAFDNQPCIGCNVTTTKPITVTAGTDTTGIDYKLVTGGRIAGIITDRASPPVPINNANVQVYSSTGAFVTSVTTSNSGKYVTSGGLAAGKYFVRVTAPGGFISALYKIQTAAPHNVNCPGCSPLTGSPVAVAVGATTADIDFALAAGGLISGTVTEASTNVPLSGISVSLYDQNNAFIVGTSTDASGRYSTVSGLPAGDYFARTSNSQGYINRIHNNTNCLNCLPNSGTAIPVTTGNTTTGIDFVLTRGGRISGTITDVATTAPISGASVTIIDVNKKTVTGALTDNAGGFLTTVGLPSGTYFVRASAGNLGYVTQVYNNTLCIGCDPTRGTGVTVTSGNTTTGINFALPLGGGYSGRVTSTETSAALGDVEVSLYTGQGTFISSGRTNADGNFGASGVPAGTYLLRTTNLAGYIDEAYDNKPCAPCLMNSTAATPITVTARTITTGLNFGLDAGGLVTGIVTNAKTGAPLEGVTVSFFQNGVFKGRSRRTNENGFYSISLPVGTYTVRPDDVNGYARPLTGSGTLRTFAETTVTVTKGGDAEVSFPLGACTPPTVSPASLPIFTAGQPYSRTLTASGGTAPYTFSVSSGTLPPGLTLNAATGVISGTPTVSGTASFTVGAADATGCSGTTDYTPFVCGVNVNTTEASFTAAAGAGNLALAANSTDCSWTATTNAPWITLGSSAGTGSAPVNYSVAANPGATSRIGTITAGGNAVTIKQGAAATEPPFGSFDTPTGATTVSGSVPVSGWALDDLGVTKVELWRDRVAGETTPVFTGPGPGNGKIYIADMLFISGARPDVAASFSSYPFASRAGWGYLMLTQGLWNQGNGTYTLWAFAFDQEGKVTNLGSKTITSNNASATKPFGSVDVPSYGQTVTGGFWNFGWALTPGSTCAITNGNVFMAIDSGTLIPVSYGGARPDIAAAFPGFTNGSGAGGAFFLDTTTITDGAHQIGWFVVDNCNRSEGIGSRFFTVANGGSGAVVVDSATNVMEAPLTAPAEGLSASREAETVATDAVSVQLDGGDATPVIADPDGWRTITVGQGSRIAVQLPSGTSYAGHQLANGERTALPLGSSFDAAAGVFRWEPAPGYLGSYHLVFVAADGSAIPVRVVVATKD